MIEKLKIDMKEKLKNRQLKQNFERVKEIKNRNLKASNLLMGH